MRAWSWWLTMTRGLSCRPGPRRLCLIQGTLIKFSSYVRKVRVEQLQSHIWLKASSVLIYGEISAYFLIYIHMTLQLLHSEFPYIWLWYMIYLIFFFFGVQYYSHGLIIAHTVKKRLAVFLSPAGMSLTKPSLTENYLIPARMSLAKPFLTKNNLIISCQGEFG